MIKVPDYPYDEDDQSSRGGLPDLWDTVWSELDASEPSLRRDPRVSRISFEHSKRGGLTRHTGGTARQGVRRLWRRVSADRAAARLNDAFERFDKEMGG